MREIVAAILSSATEGFLGLDDDPGGARQCRDCRCRRALALFDDIDDKLKSIREIRKARIVMMRRDLEDFAGQARALVESLAPELNGRNPADISVELSALASPGLAEDKTEMDRLDAE